MTVYILNALVIPADFEKYSKIKVTIRKATLEEVRQLLLQNQNEFVSAIGHESTALLLTQLLGIQIPFNRVTIKVVPGDVLIHFVLRQRVPEGKILSYEELRTLPFDLAISEIEVAE
jgi:sorbitol-specific phosphotransferase system component IIA